jgi:predicted choloylglycine hydrolase
MYHLRLKGSYYEMGRKYGSVLHKHGFKLPLIKKKRLSLGLECKEEVKRSFPEILEEIRGFADACKIDYDQLASFTLTIGGEDNQCSVFAVTDGESVFMGRNYDMYYKFKDYLESYLTMPEEGYWSLGNTDIFIGREDGINEKGLAAAMSGIVAYISPGIVFPIAIRYVLDKCATVKEGVKFLTGIPHFSTISYLLADPSGDMVAVEASPQRTVVRTPEEEGFIISANHFVHPKMVDISIYEPPDSRIRYNTIVKKLKNRTGELSEELLKSILSDHTGLVCSHRKSIKLGTLWSVVANLNKLRILRAEGHPCRAKYKPDTRLNKAILRRRRQPKLQ